MSRVPGPLQRYSDAGILIGPVVLGGSAGMQRAPASWQQVEWTLNDGRTATCVAFRRSVFGRVNANAKCFLLDDDTMTEENMMYDN